MTDAVIVALTSPRALGDHPVAAASATIWVVTETRARTIAPVETGLRTIRASRELCTKDLPPGARPPRQAQIEPGESYGRASSVPAARRLNTFNVCQMPHQGDISGGLGRCAESGAAV